MSISSIKPGTSDITQDASIQDGDLVLYYRTSAGQFRELTFAQVASAVAAKILQASTGSGTQVGITQAAITNALNNVAGAQATDVQNALDGAAAPSSNNVFATINDLPDDELTPDEQAAIQNANTPSLSNPLATQGDIPNGGGGQDADVQAALDGATSPSATNVFATIANLPSDQLTPDEQAAVENANSPNESNPFATQDELQSASVQAALDGATSPSGGNVFVTESQLTLGGQTSIVYTNEDPATITESYPDNTLLIYTVENQLYRYIASSEAWVATGKYLVSGNELGKLNAFDSRQPVTLINAGAPSGNLITTPAGNDIAAVDGDIVINSNQEYRLYRYSGSTWVDTNQQLKTAP